MSRARRLGRWAKRGLLLLGLLLVVVGSVRLAIPIALPPIIDGLVADQDLEVAWEDIAIVLRRGEVELEGVTISSRAPEAEPLVAIDFLRVEVNVLESLRGPFVIRRAYVDGLAVEFERLADGTSPLLDRIVGLVSSFAPEHPKPKPKENKPLELGLPFELRAAGLQRLKLHYRDETLNPPVDVTLFGALHVAHLGSQEQNTRLQAVLAGEASLDLLLLRAEGTSGGRNLDLDLSLEMGGLRPHLIAGLLAEAGLRPAARRLDGELRLHVQTTASPAADDALAVSIELEDLAWDADDERVAEIPKVRVQASELSLRGLHGLVAEIDHPGLVASFKGQGPVFLGLGLSKGGPPPAAPSDPQPSGGWPLTLESVSVQDATFTLQDRTRYPEVDYDVRLDQLDVANLALGSEEVAETATLELRARVPGLVEALSISGTLKPEGAGRELASTVTLAGMGLGALGGRLEASSLRTTLEGGTLECGLFLRGERNADGQQSLSFGIEEFRFADEDPLLELDRLALEDVVYDRTRSFLRVGQVDIAGTRLTATMDPEGNLTALGLHTRPREQGEPRTRGQTLAEGVATLSAALMPRRETLVALIEALLPHDEVRLELGGLDWSGGSIALVDQGEFSEFGFAISELGAQVGGLVIDGRSEREEAEARLWLRSPGYFDEIALDVSTAFTPRPFEIEARLGLAGENLEQSWLEPYLELNGLEPTFGRARFGVELTSRVAIADGDVDVATNVTDLFFEGSDGPLVGIDAITLKGAHYDEDGLDLGEIEIVAPSIRAARNADGRLELLGVRSLATTAVEQAAPAKLPASFDSPPPPPSAVQPVEPARTPEETGPMIKVSRLALRDGDFVWSDAQEGVEVNLGLLVELINCTLQGNTLAGQYVVDLQADGHQHIRVEGEAGLDEDGVQVSGAFTADHITDGHLGVYLPPGLALDLEAGQAALDFEARLGRAAAGGFSGMAAVRNLELVESDGARHAALGEARIEVARADFERGELLVDELIVRGVNTRAVIGADGALRTLGLAFSSAPESDSGEAGEAEEAATPASPASDGGPQLTTIRLEKLDLELERLEVVDERRPLSAPAELGGRITNESRLDLLTPETEEADVLRIAIQGFARPLVESLEVDFSYTPDLLRPVVSADLKLDGIHGPGLLQLVPELEDTLDPSGLLATGFGMRLDVSLELGRRGRDFGLVGTIKDAHLHNEAGESVGGFDTIYVDAPEIDLASGDIHVRTLGLLSPQGRTILRENEIEVAGLIIKTGPAQPAVEGEGAADKETAEAPAPAVARGEAEEPAPEQPTGGELLIDEATISGIDLTIVDAITEPPTSIPIDDLYVEVRGISNRALDESRPIRFEAYTNAGVADVPGEKMHSPAMEELTVEGWLELVPKPTGWFRVQLAGLELLPFRERAAESGVRIKDGTLDTSVKGALKNDKLAIDSRSVFTDLAISENEDGPIQSTLKLPVPLNVAIVLLQDSNGELIIPLSFTVNASQLSRSEMFVAMTATLSRVLIAAIAKSPFRIVNTTGQLVGLSEKEKRKPPRVETIEFAPGDATLEAPQRALVEKLREVLAKGKSTVVMTHENGTGDNALIVERATPSRAETVMLVERLRQRRREFAHMVTLAMARGRTRMATGNEEGWREASAEARRLLSEYDRVGMALNDMSKLLRADAAGHRAHREAQLLTQLGWLRIDSTYSALVAGLPPEIVSNVMLRRPLARNKREGDGGAVVITLRERK